MKCPYCGFENAADAQVCSSCGRPLGAGADLTESLPNQDATRVASLVEQRTRNLASVLEHTTVANPKVAAAEATRRIDASVPAVEEETVAGASPVDPTSVRPALKQTDDEFYVVRNTRDYDHDAQSVNHAAASDRFDTIGVENTGRSLPSDPYAKSARKGEAPGEGNSRSKFRPIMAILLIALVLGGGGAILTYGMELWGGKSVPPLVGETQGNAEASIAKKGLKVRVEAEPADDGIGRVLSQTPDPGTRIEPDSEVVIVVATNRKVPEVIGLKEEDARSVLQKAGAENIEKKEVSSSEEEGTVVDVKPGQGESFVSRNPVTIMVAIPFRVPDVVGSKERDAIKQLEEAGFSAETKYVESEESARTVIETEPAAGEAVEEGAQITLVVSSPYPTDIYHVLDYFGHSSQDIDKFLTDKGFKFEKGGTDSVGNAIALYHSDADGDMKFTPKPYLRTLTLPKDPKENPLTTGAPIAGLRFEMTADAIPGSFDRAGVEELVERCNLGNIVDYVDATTMPVPSGYAKTAAKFACATGNVNGMNWCVFIADDGGKKGFVACGKEGVYKASDLATDLAKYNNNLAQFTVYQEIYLVSGKPAEEKKDDKSKTEKDKDKDKDKAADKNADKDKDKQGTEGNESQSDSQE